MERHKRNRKIVLGRTEGDLDTVKPGGETTAGSK